MGMNLLNSSLTNRGIPVLDDGGRGGGRKRVEITRINYMSFDV